MFRKIFLQKSDGRTDPKAARVRTEKVSAHPHCHFLQQGLVLCIDGIDLYRLLAVSGTAQHLLVHFIRLGDMSPDDFRLCRHLSVQRSVDCQLLRILRRIYHRLPTFRWQVLGEFHPTLHTGPSGRRPVIRYDQYPFHQQTKVRKTKFHFRKIIK